MIRITLGEEFVWGFSGSRSLDLALKLSRLESQRSRAREKRNHEFRALEFRLLVVHFAALEMSARNEFQDRVLKAF